MKKRFINLCVMATAVMLLAGCGGSKKDDAAEAPKDNTPAAETAAAEAPEEEEPAEETPVYVSSEAPDMLVVQTPKYYFTHYDEEAARVDLEYFTEGVVVLTEGCEKLQKSLDEYNHEAYKNIETDYNNALTDFPEYAQILAQESIDAPSWSVENSISVTRADSKILSFTNTCFSDQGGAHPITMLTGHSYDTQSGKELGPEDVFVSVDDFYDYLIDYLEENCNRDGELYEDYQDMVRKMVYHEKDDLVDYTYTLEWYMDAGGVEAYFNAYDLASYAFGPIPVYVPYKGNEAMFKPGFFDHATDTVIHSFSGYTYMQKDFDGDGEDEELSVYGQEREPDSDEFVLNVSVSKGDMNNNYSETFRCVLRTTYVIEREDGRNFIYADIAEYDEDKNIAVFEITKDLDIKYVGYFTDAGFFWSDLTDVRCFYLYKRTDVLGTGMAGSSFKMGEDGMPVAVGSDRRVVKYYVEDVFNNNFSMMNECNTLTAKIDIETDGEPIKAGEKCYLYMLKSDGKAVVFREDGTKAEFSYEEANPYQCRINGMPQEDVFDGFFYAS